MGAGARRSLAEAAALPVEALELPESCLDKGWVAELCRETYEAGRFRDRVPAASCEVKVEESRVCASASERVNKLMVAYWGWSSSQDVQGRRSWGLHTGASIRCRFTSSAISCPCLRDRPQSLLMDSKMFCRTLFPMAVHFTQ